MTNRTPSQSAGQALDRDAIIEQALRVPGTRLSCARVGGRGAFAAYVTLAGQTIAGARGTSLSAALDGLADELVRRVAA